MTKIKKVDLGAEDQLKLEKYMKDLKKGKDTEKLKQLEFQLIKMMQNKSIKF